MKIKFIYFLIFLFPHFTHAKKIIVCPSCEIKNIKQGIDVSLNGDSLIIQSGIYMEKEITVNKSISIIGEKFPVVDGENKGEIFFIDADNVIISGMKIQNVGVNFTKDIAGIKINKRKNCLVENNILLNTFFGIYILTSDSCIVRNNKIKGFSEKESQTGNAIHLFRSKNILIQNNEISGHRDGIYFEFVENTKIFNNKSSGQIRYGMHFMFSHNNEYFQNEFSNNGAGVAVMYSKNIYMHENIFADNWSPVSNGILLKEISDSRIEKNIFSGNTIGIYAEGCQRNSVQFNNFSKNGWAVKILGNCEENTFLNNNFIANTFEVVTNSTKNNNFFENNFWSEYIGYDLDKDGIGDVPHSPVKLFTYIVENIPTTIILLRSLFIDLLNLAEKVAPVITPETLVDLKPNMNEIKW